MKLINLWVVVLLVSIMPNRLQAEPVSVLADIVPIHSLVSLVMEDVARPNLLMKSTASPHNYSLRPSDAAKISDANIIFYVSKGLTPWLNTALVSLASDTTAIELIATEKTVTLPFRHEHKFGEHSHSQHSEQASHGQRVISDPHAWLDPVNAQVWLGHIAAHLSKLDPQNAPRYAANAMAAIETIDQLITRVEEKLNAVKGLPFFVLHDSYHYFESRFDLHANGTIKLGDNSKPSISQISEVRQQLEETPNACVFSEPQFNDRLVKTVTRNTTAKLGQIDPLGSSIEPGKDMYQMLIEQLTHDLLDCMLLVK